jgi:predicted  nucleic acid-binding Zn-ribbon protein
MTYFECTDCGQMGDFARMERSELRQHCPVCGVETVWETAFEAEEGVSF